MHLTTTTAPTDDSNPIAKAMTNAHKLWAVVFRKITKAGNVASARNAPLNERTNDQINQFNRKFISIQLQ